MALNIFPIYKDEKKNEFLICPLKHPLINYGWSKVSITREGGRSYDLMAIGEISKNVQDSSIIYFKNIPVGFRDQNNNIVTQVVLHESNIKKEPYKSIKKCLTKERATDLDQFIKNLEDENFSDNVDKYVFEKDKNELRGTGFEHIIDDLLNQLLKNEKNLVKKYPYLRRIINDIKITEK